MKNPDRKRSRSGARKPGATRKRTAVRPGTAVKKPAPSARWVGAPPPRAASLKSVTSPLAAVTKVLGDTKLTQLERAELAGTVLQQSAEADPEVLKKCFLALYAFQTTDEVQKKATFERNRQGFDSFDGARCSKLGDKLLANPYCELTASDDCLLSRTITKYRAQIVTKCSPKQLEDIFNMRLDLFCKQAGGAPCAQQDEEDASLGDGDYDAADDSDDSDDDAMAEEEDEAEEDEEGDEAEEEEDEARSGSAGCQTVGPRGVSLARVVPKHAKAAAAPAATDAGNKEAHRSAGAHARVGEAETAAPLAGEYSISAGVLTRAGEDIFQFARGCGADTAEDILVHFHGARGVTLHDIHTRIYSSRRYSTEAAQPGDTVVVFHDGRWARGKVVQGSDTTVFAALSGTDGVWVRRSTEFMYIEVKLAGATETPGC